MNTTMADGAHDRLDAQIAEALFGQPGMSKMDVANRVRELRGDGPALLGQREMGLADALLREVCAQLESLDCGACVGSHAPMEDLHGRIAQHLAAQPSPGGRDALLGYVRVEAINALREDDEVTGVMVHVEERADSVPVYLSARPSPGGQGDLVGTIRDRDGVFEIELSESAHDTDAGALDGREVYLAARQPVDEVSVKKEDANNYCLILRALGMEEEGDPVAEVKALIEARDRQPVGEGWSGWATQYPGKMPKLYGAREIAELNHHPDEGQRMIFLTEQRAQAVDLGAVCQLAEKWMRIGGEDARFCAGELLALIDGKAVGK